MTCEFMQKFNEQTQNKYDYLRLSSSVLLAKERKLRLNFIYPDEYFDIFNQQKEDIEKALNAILQLQFTSAEFYFKRSHFDFSHFVADVKNFFGDFPAISASINVSDILVFEQGGGYKVQIRVFEAFEGYIKNNKIDNQLLDYLARNYCQKIDIEYVIKPDEEIEQKPSSGVSTVERKIFPNNIEKFIGEVAADRADYISDIKSPRQFVSLCGKIKSLVQIEKKNKVGIESKDNFFKFELTDFTGTIACLLFPNKYNFQKIKTLIDGTEAIISGEVKLNSFGGGKLELFARTISLCKLPKDMASAINYRPLPQSYGTVFPKSTVHTEQIDLLGKHLYRKTPFYTDNSFVVFDLETTGLASGLDKIIEIGAVKIENGQITEEFSTFINPKIPISARITEITGITDKDVDNAPTMDKVIGDFLLFCKGSILVAHNAPFDCGFIEAECFNNQYKFEFKSLDTIELARKFVPELKSFNLGAVSKYFGIDLKNAHRAIHDARATAQAFLKIIDRTQGKPDIA